MSKKRALNTESINQISNNIVTKTFANDNLFVNYNKKKEPVSPFTKRLISVINRSNLVTFENALIGLKNASKIEGIGIVLG